MAERLGLTGNDAVAFGLKQVNPDVIPAYPITPQTEMMHQFAAYEADGLVDTELILVESEHSAMSASVGASLAGVRVATATSSCGLALMWEILYVASSCRCPIVMHECNRALSAPINIHCDHSDTMGARDTGWIQVYAETVQEAYDNIIQGFRIAEHLDVRLPIMSTIDGFILSHTLERLDVLDDDEVQAFIGEYKSEYSALDVENPKTFGAFALQNYYFEFKRQQVEAMKNALQVIPEVGEEYGKLSGRSYGLVEGYKLDDAEIALVALGSTNGTARIAVDKAREAGLKAGLLKIRCFRPFPFDAILGALKNAKVVGVLDRAVSFGFGGPLFHEIRSAGYGKTDFLTKNIIYGLGGRDINDKQILDVIRSLDEAAKVGRVSDEPDYIGLRE